MRKSPLRVVQVCDEKTNVCEPLLTHRKHPMVTSKPGMEAFSGTKARVGCVPSARKRPACGPGGVRCIGGVSSSQALAWNRRTCRSDAVPAVGVGLLSRLVGREGGPPAARTVRGRVPMRGTGAGRPVVAAKAL